MDREHPAFARHDASELIAGGTEPMVAGPGRRRLTSAPSRRRRVRPSPGLEARRLALLALFEDEFRPPRRSSAGAPGREHATDPGGGAPRHAIVEGVIAPSLGPGRADRAFAPPSRSASSERSSARSSGARSGRCYTPPRPRAGRRFTTPFPLPGPTPGTRLAVS
jgi:hypothetical protein